MKSFILSSSDFEKTIKAYKSGAKIEACINIKSDTAELVKLRPLGPKEAVFIYSGTIKACPATKGCKNFDKSIEEQIHSDSAGAADLSDDYFSCQK